MKKFFATGIIALILTLVSIIPALSANTIQILVDGKSIAMDAPPVVSNGTTLVPMRAIFESLGADVNYNATTKQIQGTKGNDTILLTLNQTTAKKNNDIVNLSMAPQTVSGRTMVPLRFISESLNCNVDWNKATQTITISSVNDNSLTANNNTLYEVIRIVDGDTIVINYNGAEEKVRLIGVDTPESVHPDASKNTEAGKTASAYTTELLTGKSVSLEFDVQERDKYGRLLAYVYLDGVMVNKTLLETGYANIATYPPNVKYVDDFTKIVAARNQNSEQTTAPTPNNTQYYRTATGKKYHADSTCNGGTYIPCTLDEAKSLGLAPCSKCIG